MLDAYASLPHYAEHIAAVWSHVPEGVAGVFWRPRANAPWGTAQLSAHRDPTRWVLVAGHADAQKVRPSPVVYLEHGAGQAYDADPVGAGAAGYSGAGGLDHCRLFLCPNDAVAARWRARYPDTPAVVVGSPKLDAWHAGGRRGARRPEGAVDQEHPPGVAPAPRAGTSTPPAATPVVAVTFHWDCPLLPETRSAWPHYRSAMPALAADPRWRVLGHSHPRLWSRIERVWRQQRIDATPSLAEVFARADLLVGDNTSALYEFASLGRPVVVLNAPWYRRDVHHGLRFWSHLPGLQVDAPAQLPEVVASALADPPAARALRARAVAAAYAHTDGRAGRRAAAAITKELHRA